MARKRPIQKRSQDRVKKILDATNEIVESESLKKISTNFISRKSGVSIGSIYQYFKNKEEIFKALYEHLNPKVNQIFDEEDVESKSIEQSFEKMEKALERLVDQFIQYKKHIRLYNTMKDRAGLQKLILKSRRNSSQRVAKYLASDFGLSEERAKVSSYMLVNSFIGTVHNHVWELVEFSEPSLSTDELKVELKLKNRLYIVEQIRLENFNDI